MTLDGRHLTSWRTFLRDGARPAWTKPRSRGKRPLADSGRLSYWFPSDEAPVCTLQSRGRRRCSWRAAISGEARRTSTARRYLDAGNVGGFDIDDQFTLSAWIYSDSDAQTAASSRA